MTTGDVQSSVSSTAARRERVPVPMATSLQTTRHVKVRTSSQSLGAAVAQSVSSQCEFNPRMRVTVDFIPEYISETVIAQENVLSP